MFNAICCLRTVTFCFKVCFIFFFFFFFSMINLTCLVSGIENHTYELV